jgi:site-specific DNA recombinase
LFEAVQAKLDQQRTNHARVRQQSHSLLMGRIFDDRGNRMTPTYAVKNGIRYRYYISAPLLQSQSDKAAKLNRVPAAEIERLIIGALRKQLGINRHDEKIGEDNALPTDKELISTHVARVDVKQDHLAIQLLTVSAPQSGMSARRWPKEQEASEGGSRGDEQTHPTATTLLIPWKKKPAKQPRAIIAPSLTGSPADPRPIRAETRAKLITAIATGRRWLDELITGTVTNAEQIAQRETCSIRQVNRTITLAFLAPALVQAAIDGRLPRGIGVASLRDFPAEWKRQHEILGLSS